MAKEKFVLVSLKEEKAKQLANVIANPSCTKILEYLADKDHATESQIAKDLKIPISTVHYNLQQLTMGKLVSVEEFHYSEKGKEVNHYKLANQYIIIAPRTTEGLRERLKGLFGITILSLGAAAIISFFHNKSTFIQSKAMTMVAAPIADQGSVVATEGARIATDVATSAAAPTIASGVAQEIAPTIATEVAQEAAKRTIEPVTQIAAPIIQSSITITSINPAVWFLYGAACFLGFILILEIIRMRREK